MPPDPVLTVLCAVVLAATASVALAQQAPAMAGPLSKAHAALASGNQCQRCHSESGKISASLCLACHKPIADRIAAKKGVHRDADGACASCHVEHHGADADLRPLDPSSFDHAGAAGFPLVGRHAKTECARCHKTRSYLGNRPDCASCHTDGHQGALGAACATCHTPVATPPARSTRWGCSRSKASTCRCPARPATRAGW
jgi:hypothetical protein